MPQDGRGAQGREEGRVLEELPQRVRNAALSREERTQRFWIRAWELREPPNERVGVWGNGERPLPGSKLDERIERVEANA